MRNFVYFVEYVVEARTKNVAAERMRYLYSRRRRHVVDIDELHTHRDRERERGGDPDRVIGIGNEAKNNNKKGKQKPIKPNQYLFTIFCVYISIDTSIQIYKYVQLTKRRKKKQLISCILSSPLLFLRFHRCCCCCC